MGSTYRKIWQGPADGTACHPLTVEGVAAAAIRPGAQVVKGASTIAEGAIAATVFGKPLLLAQELGSHKGGIITTPWATGETISAVQLRTGEFALALVSAGNNITTELTGLSRSATAGELKIAATDGTEDIVAYSRKIVNVTGAAALVEIVGA